MFGVRPLVSLEVLLSVESLATLLHVALEWKLGRGLVGPHVLIQIPTSCEGLQEKREFFINSHFKLKSPTILKTK